MEMSRPLQWADACGLADLLCVPGCGMVRHWPPLLMLSPGHRIALLKSSRCVMAQAAELALLHHRHSTNTIADRIEAAVAARFRR